MRDSAGLALTCPSDAGSACSRRRSRRRGSLRSGGRRCLNLLVHLGDDLVQPRHPALAQVHGGQTLTLARHGGREVRHEFTREYEARAMVDRLIAAAPGNWKDITRLVSKPPPASAAGDEL